MPSFSISSANLPASAASPNMTGTIAVATPSANNAELVGQLDHANTDHEYPPTLWAAGEVVQEQVQISAAKLQVGSNAVCMGMYAPVIEMRAIGEAGPGVVVDNRAIVGVSAWAIVMRSTAGMRGASAVGDGCRVQRVPAAAQALTRNRRSVIVGACLQYQRGWPHSDQR